MKVGKRALSERPYMRAGGAVEKDDYLSVKNQRFLPPPLTRGGKGAEEDGGAEVEREASNPSKCDSPVDIGCHQFKNWWRL